MAVYSYECECGRSFDRVMPVAEYRSDQFCKCGKLAQKIITKPMMGIVKGNVCYDSPIDGRPITSWRARQEDLARNGCQEYDPEMKTDYHRRIKREEAELDKQVDATVEAEIERMPVRKREMLDTELKHGAEAVPERGTVPISTIRSI